MNTRQGFILVAVVSMGVLPAPVRANPVGGVVRVGNASFQAGLGTLTIHQTTPKVIIDWRDFSIGAGEVTRFVQPGANAAALNRVSAGNPSLIYGTLQANGRVYLLNPNGILVGPSGRIDTRHFVGSTLNVSDESFLKDAKLSFSGSSTAPIRNEGQINALGGDVYLIARTVENAGTIRAPQGKVGLAAGTEVILQESAPDSIGVVARAADGPLTAQGVNNTGVIEATAAELKAAGGNIYALAINNGGIVRATSVSCENGRIVLKARGGNIENSGTLVARNADGGGGSVVVDAGRNSAAPATAVNTGTIDARGQAAGAKGGTVVVTGDQVELRGASSIDVSGNAGGGTALIGGGYRGGNPEVRNAQDTFVGSDATVKADALARGDGGQVVVWADDTARVHGTISANGGPLGGNGGFVETSGKRSLDVFGAVVTGSAFLGRRGTWLLDPADLVINDATSIENALNSGTDVPVESSTYIILNDSITSDAPGLLTFLARNGDITLNASITLRNGSLSLGTDTGSIFQNAGAVQVGGNTWLSAGKDVLISQSDNQLGKLFLTAGGNATLREGSDTVLTHTDLGQSTIGGNLRVTSSGDITQSGILEVAGNSRFDARGAILLGLDNILEGAVEVSGAADLTLRNTAGLPSDRLSLFTSGSFTRVAVTYDNAGLRWKGTLEARAGVEVTAGGLLNVQGNVTGTGVSLSGVGIKQASDSTVNGRDGTITVDAGGGAITLAGTFTTTSADAEALVLKNATTATLGNLNVPNGTLVLGKAEASLSGDVIQHPGSTIEAKSLNASVTGNGNLVLGVDATDNQLDDGTYREFVPSHNNRIEALGQIDVAGDFYLYDDSSLRVGYTTENGTSEGGDWITGYAPDPAGTGALGLAFTDTIVAHGHVTIRTRGDIWIKDNAKIDVHGARDGAEVVLSAENSNPSDTGTALPGDFHNSDQPDTEWGGEKYDSPVLAIWLAADRGQRYIVYSTSAEGNFPISAVGTTGQNFNGLGGFIRQDPGTFPDTPPSLLLPPDFGGNGFVFANGQKQPRSEEASKFIVDVLKLKAFAGLDFEFNPTNLPPVFPPTIYTSSYHVYERERLAAQSSPAQPGAPTPPKLSLVWPRD